jgi:two-component system OmpR family sensor kinase
MSRLAWRIFLAFFATLLAVALGAVAITSWHLDSQREAARNEVRLAVQAAAVALAEDGREGLAVWAGGRQASRRFLVVDDWGLELLGRPIPAAMMPALAGGRAEALSGFPDVIVRSPQRFPTLTSDDGERFRLLPLPAPQRRVGPLAMPDVRLSLMLMALAVTALASLWLARSITRPVLDLQRATETLAAGRLDARVPARTAARRDELGRLASAFDSMAARIGALLQSRERLLRDVSHEIRSPLARMRLATGLAAQGADPATQFARLDAEVGRLDALVSDLLDLSRLAPGAPPLAQETVELLPLMERVVADARFEAGSLDKRIEWAPPAAVVGAGPRTLGDPHWITASIENVVRNALRHTPRGTAVTLRIETAQDGHALTVGDAGPGLPEDQLAQVFEPFHRVAADRDPHPEGAGLGLAIAARAMQAHGGRIEARNLPGATPAGAPAGLEMRLWWPAADGRGASPGTGTLNRD